MKNSEIEKELSVAVNKYNNALINNDLTSKRYYGDMINNLRNLYNKK